MDSANNGPSNGRILWEMMLFFRSQTGEVRDPRTTVVLGAALVGAMIMLPLARAQEAPGCTREKSTYTCNWDAFLGLLPRLHSVTVEVPRTDRFAAAELRNLVARMGKNTAAQDQPADLTVTIVQPEPGTVDMGPAEHPLAMLQIYSGNSVTGDRKLLWVETYAGPGDRPWPSNVHAVIEQFEARLHRR